MPVGAAEGTGWRRRAISIALCVILVGVFVWLGHGVWTRIHGMGDPSEAASRRFRDFYEFYSGARALREGTDLYSAGELGYVYPPLLAFLLVPLAGLGIEIAGVVWLGVKLGILALCLWLSTDEVVRRVGSRRDAPAVLGVATLGLLLIVDKVRGEMNMQQSSLLMLLGWVLALRWVDRRPWLAGLALGFAANIKYLTLLAVPYLLVRRRYKAAIAALVSTVGWALLPAVYIGWGRNLDYLSAALAGLRQMTGNVPDQPGIAKVMRVHDFGFSIPRWAATVTSSADTNAATLVATAAAAAAFLGAIWLVYRVNRTPLLVGRGGEAEAGPHRAGLVLIEWIGLMVTALAFSPQTNMRHLSQLLLTTVCLAYLLICPARGVARWPVVLSVLLLEGALGLPPGGPAGPYRGVIEAWDSIAGRMWCIMAASLLLLHGALARSAQGPGSAEPREGGGSPASGAGAPGRI